MSDAGFLDEQLSYYRARAGEYDEWWHRQGRYDRGVEENARWFAEIGAVHEVFDARPLSGEVLELAPATGYRTELLALRASSVTAVDGSPEMIDLYRARLAALPGNVDYRRCARPPVCRGRGTSREASRFPQADPVRSGDGCRGSRAGHIR